MHHHSQNPNPRNVLASILDSKYDLEHTLHESKYHYLSPNIQKLNQRHLKDEVLQTAIIKKTS